MIPLAALLLVTALDPTVIEAIELEGNDRVKSRILLQELPFAPGDTVDLETIERGRQAILDLGLFESVSYRLERGVLTYVVDEKYLWFAVPRLDRSGDGDLTYGVDAKIYNLGGLNQTLEIDATRTQLEAADVDEEREIEASYRYPRLFGGPFELIADAGYLTAELDERRGDRAGRYERRRRTLSVGTARWLQRRGPSRGWRAGGAIRLERFDHTLLEGDPTLFFDATLTTFSAFAQLFEVHDYVLSREGREWLYTIDVPDRDSTTRHQLTYRRYHALGWREHHTLNVQLRLAHASGTLFGDPAYSLGGSRTLRGFDRDASEGDAFVVANAEWLVPLWKEHPQLRGAVVLDAGNAYPGLDDADLTDLRVGAGIGLRWRIRKLVDVELRGDIVQGLNRDGETKLYAATNATF